MLSRPHLPKVRGSSRAWLLAGTAGLLLAAGLPALLPSTAPPMPETSGIDRAPAQTPPPPASPPAAAPVSADISGLTLRGVMGGASTGAAIVEFPGGRQARFPVGREIVPGVSLKAIEPQSALLSSQDGDRRLTLPGADLAGLAAAAPTKETAAPDIARQTIAFRTSLAPHKRKDGKIIGFAIRPDADLPILAKAGLKPGDVVIAINGRAFATEAEVDKLANEIRISPTVVLEYERNGRRSETRIDTR